MDIQPKSYSKDILINNIKNWVAIDTQLKNINEKTRIIRNTKNELTKEICNTIENSNMKNKKITITDGSLSVYEKKDYEPLTYNYIEKCLKQIIAEEESVDYIIQYIKDNRNVTTISDIRRTYNKS